MTTLTCSINKYAATTTSRAWTRACIAPMGDYGATNHPMRELGTRMHRTPCAQPRMGTYHPRNAARLRLASLWCLTTKKQVCWS